MTHKKANRMSELTQAQREAMGEKMDERFGTSHLDVERETEYEAGFLAGLRYQDEPSEAEVEAAARAIFKAEAGWPDFMWAQVKDARKDQCREMARAALKAAREVRGDGT